MVSMNAQIAPVAPSTSSNNKRGKVIDWAALALAVGIISPIRLRPFLPVHDQPAIESICASVHCAIDIESGDYLPGLAASMAADPACSLLVLTENDDVVSVANVKRLTPSISWLEAVRTSPERRGRGLASRLCSAHTAVAAAEGRRLLSATVSSNHGMQKAFARCGLTRAGSLHLLDLGTLRDLPGWAGRPEEEQDDHQGTAAAPAPQSLLAALGLEEHVDHSARALAARFVPLRSGAELRMALRATGGVGGSGCMPGLYKLLGDDALSEALREGRVFWLARPACVVALCRDPSLSSLRSPWVCSISCAGGGGATDDADDADLLSAAVWRASEEHGQRPFCLSVDGSLPRTPGGLLDALPLTADPCLVYSA